jgi:sulfonate dioxygenase
VSLRQSTRERETEEVLSKESRWRPFIRWLDVSRGAHIPRHVRIYDADDFFFFLLGHPVTGEKALYVNKQFSRHIVGLKQEESEAILNLL